jgi:extracellular factor (EF) 3-hydroxypalmitic acid methyl ester biosynthesis protein
VTNPESDLVAASRRFATLSANGNFDQPQTFHDVGAAIVALCAALARAERAGLSREAMRELIPEARDMHALSPFVNRLQVWPEGYPGDYVTVEQIMTQANRADAGTLGALIERFCLATSIGQQHRNKMQRQAAEILATILGTAGIAKPRILVLAAGSSPDLRSILDFVRPRDFQVVLNDSDPEALAFSLRELAPIRDKIVVLEGNALRCAEEILELGPYDLIAAGGLFDYLDTSWASKFVSPIMNEWLASGGSFFFTNIAKGNPYRLWMECVTDWEMIERTEQDLVELVSNASTSKTCVQVTRDATSLTLLAKARCIVGD